MYTNIIRITQNAPKATHDVCLQFRDTTNCVRLRQLRIIHFSTILIATTPTSSHTSRHNSNFKTQKHTSTSQIHIVQGKYSTDIRQATQLHTYKPLSETMKNGITANIQLLFAVLASSCTHYVFKYLFSLRESKQSM